METHLCFLPVFFNSNSQSTGLSNFCFPGSAVALEEGMSQPRGRWEMLAPRSDFLTVLLPPDCFLSIFLGLHCWSLHRCASTCWLLLVVWKQPVQLHQEVYYFPKAGEEKEPGSPLVRGVGVRWAGEDIWLLSAASCVLAGCIWDTYACVLFCIVFLYTSSMEGCHYAQYLTKSMNHYFIFLNPKMLKCFHGKQNIFKNCSIEFTKINLLSLSVDFQQDGCLHSFFPPFYYCVAGKGTVSPRPSDFKSWL